MHTGKESVHFEVPLGFSVLQVEGLGPMDVWLLGFVLTDVTRDWILGVIIIWLKEVRGGHFRGIVITIAI